MGMLDWLFTASTPSQAAFCPLPLEKFDHSPALLWYLSDKKLLEQGGAPNPIRHSYVFTVTDMRYLLINRFDLTHVNYVVNDVSFVHYEKLYNIAFVNQLPLTGLHGLQADFSTKDLTGYPDHFVLSCTPASLQHAIIELPKLSHMAKNPENYACFSKEDLQFTVSYYDANTNTQNQIDIDAQKFHDTIDAFTSTHCFRNKAALIDQIRRLSANILNIDEPISADISKGELLLSALVCAFHARHNPVSILFWETQIKKEQPCSESDMALLSKISNC